MSLIQVVFAQAQEGAGAAGGSQGPSMFVMLGLMFVVMYFLVIRPQRKEEKRKKNMWATLKKGDPVVTQGGMHGVVQSVDQEKSVAVVKIGDNTKVKFNLTSIIQLKGEPEKK